METNERQLNNGQAQRAWPLIGLLTRAIDYLQLTTEPSTTQVCSLMKPVRLVQPSNDHTQLSQLMTYIEGFLQTVVSSPVRSL
jgi:hypothetical protein